MDVNSIEREEMISKLTEIYHQLEKVESLLDSNISQKTNWQFSYSTKIREINHRISELEQKEVYLDNTCSTHKIKVIEQPQKLKLKLGY